MCAHYSNPFNPFAYAEAKHLIPWACRRDTALNGASEGQRSATRPEPPLRVGFLAHLGSGHCFFLVNSDLCLAPSRKTPLVTALSQPPPPPRAARDSTTAVHRFLHLPCHKVSVDPFRGCLLAMQGALLILSAKLCYLSVGFLL